MDDIPCPEPEHLWKAAEIRQEVNRVALAASWPSAIISAISCFLAAVLALIAAAARVDPAVFFIIFLILTYPTPKTLERRIAGGLVPTGRNLDLNVISIGEGMPWWGYVLAIPVALLIGFIVSADQNTPMVFLAVLWAWLGIVWLASGWVSKRWNQILMGFLLLATVVFLGRSTPKGGDIGNEFAILLSIAGIAEAGFAWWAWREWKKDPARFESILT